MTQSGGTSEFSLAKSPEATAPRTCLVVPTLAIPTLQWGYSYTVPEGMEVEAGGLVLVNLRGQIRKGIVVALDPPAPEGIDLKPLLAVFPGGALMTPQQLELAEWLARFYHTSLFSALHLNFWDLKFFRTTHGWRIADPRGALELLEQKGYRFTGDTATVEEFEDQVFSEGELGPFWAALELRGTEADMVLPHLIAHRFLVPDYKLRQVKRKPIEPAYKPAPDADVDDLTPKEAELWRGLLKLSPPWHWEQLSKRFTGQRAYWTRLVKKDCLIPLVPLNAQGHGSQHHLSLKQADALDAILPSLKGKEPRVHLLQGITGSGKTEVYLRAAEAALQYGTVLFLVPEIALTHQTVARVTHYFGSAQVGLLHSGQTDKERRAVWEAVRANEVRVLIGPRSALFAPAAKISLVILDEEHEGAYKQNAHPRYHARTVAQKLIELHDATLVLGSATPSLETYLGARRKAVGYHVLPERAGLAHLPSVRIVPLSRGSMVGDQPTLTPELQDLIEATYNKGRQSLLFLNQRGFAKCLRCQECADVPRCPRCAIALTHHARARKLVCHHCDFTRGIPRQCDRCTSQRMSTLGFGTQQVETAVRQQWPLARVARLDRDITTQRGAMERILADFGAGEIDILVGTQMVAKGLDIPGLAAVGVILADMGLTLPDFRAAERTFQLLTQVAGRAGRREEPGEVIIQAFAADHPIIRLACEQDYTTFAHEELALRRALYYPPFCRMVRLLFEDVSGHLAQGVAQDAAHFITQAAGERIYAEGEQRIAILGPAPAPLEKLKNRYRYHVLLKVPRVSHGVALVEAWEQSVHRRLPKTLRVTIDVDPVDML